MRYIALLITLSITAFAEVREVRPDVHQIPSNIPPAPTLAERIEQRARMAALKEQREVMRELAGISAGIHDSTTISNQTTAIRERVVMVAGLSAIIADTRSNITEVAELSDVEIAGLYLQQMRKSTTPLLELVPVDTVEYVIGTGIRQDLTTSKKGKSNESAK